MSRARIRSLGVLGAFVFGGCQPNPPHGIRPLRPLELATVPYAGNVTSAVTGSLSYERSCLLLQPDKAGRPVFPVWPEGSVFNGTSVIFHRPGKADQPVVIGQEVRLEGRAISWSELPDARYRPFENQCGSAPFLVSGVRPAD